MEFFLSLFVKYPGPTIKAKTQKGVKREINFTFSSNTFLFYFCRHLRYYIPAEYSVFTKLKQFFLVASHVKTL